MKVRSVEDFPAPDADDLAIFVWREGRNRVRATLLAVPHSLVALTLHDTIFSRWSNFGTKRTGAQIDGSGCGPVGSKAPADPHPTQGST